MELSTFSSRKRPRSCRRSMFLKRHETPEATETAVVGTKRRGGLHTYQSAFSIGVLLVQLARVHSWSPSLTSVIAKKSSLSSSRLVAKDAAEDSLFVEDRPSIPSSELLSSRYLIPDSKRNNNKNENLWRMVAPSSGSQSPGAPSMLLQDDFFFPVSSSKSLATSESVRKGMKGGSSSMASDVSAPKDREGRVLGFDVFALHAQRPDGNGGSDEPSFQAMPLNHSESFFLAPGLSWENAPLPNTVSDDALAALPASTTTPTTASTLATGGKPLARNGGVRLLKYNSPQIPAWFPWVPTKSQIMSLKLKELKEACSQRGLVKTGNKDVLQERLWGWTIEHQMQHQARLSGEFLTGWFENDDPNSFLLERERQKGKNTELDPTGEFTTDATTTNDNTNTNTPNSLDEWSRSFDAEKLTQKRQEIHRQKRVGKKPNTLDATSWPRNHKSKAGTGNAYKHNNNNNNKKQQSPAATKEYLTKLANAFKTSPSSPYASNKDVRELYDASKKADQLGEPLLAIELLESLVKLTPNDARVYRRLSRMHNDQGHLDVARATLQEGLRKLPHNPWLWHGMGQLEVSQGRAEYGIRCYQRAIQEDPTFAHSYHAWGIYEFNNGQIAKSMKILKKGIEYCPTNHRLHHALGDLYRGAKLPKDAERSYKRALEEGPRVSHSFALSALASVAYEQGNVDEARRWLYQSIATNNGRHAQGWLALAEIEEAEGNVEEALKVCEASIIRYERELVEARKRYKRGSSRGKNKNQNHESTPHRGHRGRFHLDVDDDDDDKPFADPTKSKEVERGLLKSIPKYRSGDKFLSVFRHWARLEGRYGTYDGCNRIYKRASLAFPLDYKIPLDWARYHANIRSRLARRHFAEACTRASTKNAEPYREYASFEMSLGEYETARKILFRGAQAVARSPDGGTETHNQLELARLYVTWAVCEWHLQNTPRVEVLFDHALRLTEVGSAEGSELRSFVLFCIAQLEYYERGELHLAQNCIGLCLKENALPGGNAPVWNLWAKIARGLENSHLEDECRNEAKRCKMRLEDLKEDDHEGSSAWDTMNMLKGSQNIQNLMRQQPWFDKLRAVRTSWGEDENDDASAMSSSSRFYSSLRIPNFENHDLRREVVKEERIETQPEEASI